MFSRLCVDLDDRGNVRGVSIEMHDSQGPTTLWTTAVGPFDDVHAALEIALQRHADLVGEQGALF